MFEEKLIIRAAAQETRNRAAPSIHQIAICCFGKTQSLSLAAISQTLNKLVIRDISANIELVRVDNRSSFKTVKDAPNYGARDDSSSNGQIAYVLTRDVINSLSVHKLELDVTNSSDLVVRDLLFIGCSSSIVVYDTYEQTNLFNIHTASGITSLLCIEARDQQNDPAAWPIALAGGVQKLHLVQIERLTPILPTTNLDKLLNIEVTSERSTSDTVTCLCHGRCGGIDLVVTGSIEQKIRVYSLDTLDRNIQACRLTLNEPSRVDCLCAIATVQPNDDKNQSECPPSALQQMSRPSLPAIREESEGRQFSSGRKGTQMNYFAYGLENGSIGVYRLIWSCSGVEISNCGQERLLAERLWRHKSKLAPVSIVLYDVDGDGLDELVFGYSNGRLEARSPFTGQLMAKTRSFRSDELLCLGVSKSIDFQERVTASIISPQTLDSTQDKIDSNNPYQTMLLACSVSMSFVVYWRDKSKPHKPMLDYLATRFDKQGLVQRTSGQSIDEMDESENWTNSLIDFSSIDPEVAQEEQLEQTTLVSPKTGLLGHISQIQQSDEKNSSLRALESQADTIKPIQCEVRQNSELLCRLAALHNDNNHLRRNLSKFYFDKVQQMSSFEFNSLTTGLNLAYRWDFDTAKNKLRLSLLVSNLTGMIELFELVDSGDNLIKSGHFLMDPGDNHKLRGNSLHTDGTDRVTTLSADSKSNLVLLPIEPFHQETETRLRIRLYCQQLGSREIMSNHPLDPTVRNQFSSEQSSQPSVVSRVYEATILMPRFSMFVPEVPLAQEDAPDETLTMSFKLDEDTSYLQILNWMRTKFLCFQFGQLHNDNGKSIWPDVDAGDLVGGESPISALGDDRRDGESSNIRPSVSLSMRWDQYLPFDRPENWSSGRVGPNGEMELELRLKSLKPSDGQTKSIFGSKLRITYSLARVLAIECQDIDVMTEIIESLIVDCLKLNSVKNSVETKRDGGMKLDAADIELAAITEKTRQLEESEQRIQTELYESDAMIKNLMQQFAIANQLNEFKTSKELLNEISMMLDAAQNSAKAYQLNNRERLKMSRDANNLREKMSFLLNLK